MKSSRTALMEGESVTVAYTGGLREEAKLLLVRRGEGGIILGHEEIGKAVLDVETDLWRGAGEKSMPFGRRWYSNPLPVAMDVLAAKMLHPSEVRAIRDGRERETRRGKLAAEKLAAEKLAAWEEKHRAERERAKARARVEREMRRGRRIEEIVGEKAKAGVEGILTGMGVGANE
jgi:hypothetical protein